jgi:hypothetical protein
MKFTLYEEAVLTKDIPEEKLIKGDLATIVDFHPVADGEDGYSLEVFNALGDTIAVITVAESSLAPLTENVIFNARERTQALDSQS